MQPRLSRRPSRDFLEYMAVVLFLGLMLAGFVALAENWDKPTVTITVTDTKTAPPR